jgi:polar amino acid transport system ATP-binding protein
LGKQLGDPFIIINEVHKTYRGGLDALAGVSLTVRRSQTVVIIGPSGAGKSTLLRCLCGLETVDRGRIVVEGHDLTADPKLRQKMRPELGMVFQSFNLFPHLTALENISLAPIKVRRQSPEVARALGRELLEKVGLADKAEVRPCQLSGGQQQRVAIARALAMQPKVMLFDEATSALDPEMIGEVLVVMKDLALSGVTMLVVTHEMGFAREAGDLIVFMDQGRILEETPAEEFFLNPTSGRAGSFINKILESGAGRS